MGGSVKRSRRRETKRIPHQVSTTSQRMVADTQCRVVQCGTVSKTHHTVPTSHQHNESAHGRQHAEHAASCWFGKADICVCVCGCKVGRVCVVVGPCATCLLRSASRCCSSWPGDPRHGSHRGREEQTRAAFLFSVQGPQCGAARASWPRQRVTFFEGDRISDECGGMLLKLPLKN